MKLRMAVGQLALSGGVRQQVSPHLAVIEPESRSPLGRGKPRLYVVVETADHPAGRDQACRRIIEVISQEYPRAIGGVTSSLRQAIMGANLALLRHNQDSPEEMRQMAGVSCVVIKDNDVYIGQAGPALVYVWQQGRSQRFPRYSPWLEESPPAGPLEAYAIPLGLRKDLPIDLFHCQVQPGDVILLASSGLAGMVSEDSLSSALPYQEVDRALHNLQTLAKGRDLSAIVVEMIGRREERRPEPVVEEEPEEVIEERPAAAERMAAPLAGGLNRLTTAAREAAAGLDLAGLVARAADGAVAGLALLVAGSQTLLKRVLPEREAPPRPRVASTRPSRPRPSGLFGVNRWVLIGLLIPLLLALLVVSVRFQYEQSRQARFVTLVQEAQTARETALTSQDKGVMRQVLLQARDKVEEALEIRPEDEAARQLALEIQSKLDELSHVVSLHWLPELYHYTDEGGQIGRVLVQGIDVYLLDKGLNRVYKHLLNQTGDGLQPLEHTPVLLRSGDQRGEVVVTSLVDMVWAEAGGARSRANLLTMDSEGHLLEYDPAAGLSVLPLAVVGGWQPPRLIGSYLGNLYLLDDRRSRILKYVPTFDGYSDVPTDYLSPQAGVDLAGAVDMAIDGYIWVLLADGTILKLNQGRLEPFKPTGLDEPLREPTALCATGDMESGALYVADAGNGRIVQLGKDGTFQRQFRPGKEPRTFPRLTGLFVDQAKGKLYIVSDNRLYLANLPTE